MTDTYITRARAALLAALGDTERDWEREPRLLDLYTLLVLIKGTECSAEDVHDAWAVARQRERPAHPALVPFSLLDDSAARLDIPFRGRDPDCRPPVSRCVVMYDHAERLTTEWAVERIKVTTASERDLARWILLQLADPTSDYGELLDELCQSRWTSPVPLRAVSS